MNSKDFFYSPTSNSSISLIYPWNNWLIDLFTLIATLIINNKLRKKNIFFLQTIFDHKNIFLTNSGSAALTIGIKSLLLPKNSEILLTSFNCPAVADSIISAGAKPVFIDINRYGGISIKNAKKALSKKTKAIIATNIYGLADNLDLLRRFCKNNNIYLINDLAQPFDNLNSKNKLNKIGDISIYSFGPQKHIFSLGGGCLMVNNKDLIKNVKNAYPKECTNNLIDICFFLQRCIYYLKFIIFHFFPQIINFNIQKKEVDIIRPKIVHISQMSNGQLFDLSLKLHEYQKYYEFTKKNFDLLCSRSKYEIICNKNNYTSLPLYATMKVGKKQRYDFSLYLDKHKISSTWNYLPLYYYKAYKKFKVIGNTQTEYMWKKVLSIPFRYPINKKIIYNIIEVINNY